MVLLLIWGEGCRRRYFDVSPAMKLSATTTSTTQKKLIFRHINLQHHHTSRAMIARSVSRCSPLRRIQISKLNTFTIPKQRRFSSSSPSTASHSNPSSPASMLAAFTDELDKIAPRFEINGSQIQVLHSPADFYQTLKVGKTVMILGTRELMVAVKNIEGKEDNIPLYSLYWEDWVWACKNTFCDKNRKISNNGWRYQHYKLPFETTPN